MSGLGGRAGMVSRFQREERGRRASENPRWGFERSERARPPDENNASNSYIKYVQKQYSRHFYPCHYVYYDARLGLERFRHNG